MYRRRQQVQGWYKQRMFFKERKHLRGMYRDGFISLPEIFFKRPYPPAKSKKHSQHKLGAFSSTTQRLGAKPAYLQTPAPHVSIECKIRHRWVSQQGKITNWYSGEMSQKRHQNRKKQQQQNNNHKTNSRRRLMFHGAMFSLVYISHPNWCQWVMKAK